ncbi:hypothetical protein RN001_009942 [Aquatica leii]|uniref:Uncharacterized protein n=1 Tax=Aquatica leii TaxID=1421715 RepID=A0AAN7P8P3_9COLE|nr:hypothetical protein RN001_009942 [Aquatica leii]
MRAEQSVIYKPYQCDNSRLKTNAKMKMEELVQKHEKSIKPVAVKTNTVERHRKKIKPTEHDTSDEEKVMSSSDDESECDFQFNELDGVPKKHDYVLVDFNTKERKIYYVGKILTDIDENEEYEVSFFRKSEKFEKHFVLPVNLDMSLIKKTDIKMILPDPILHGKTKRQQSFLSF